MKYIAPTWDEIYKMCINLAETIRSSGELFESIVAVSRGGLTPARILSDLLDIKELHALRCEYYKDINEARAAPKILGSIDGGVKDHYVLVVDDVADSGDSLKLVKKHILLHGAKDVKIAVLYTKPWNKMKVDYYSDKTDAWVIFPWERLEVIRSFLKKGARRPDLLEAGLSKDILERLECLAKFQIETDKD